MISRMPKKKPIYLLVQKKKVGRETFNFKLADAKGEEFHVVYKGVKPSNFEQATEVVAIGRFNNGIFEAEQLLVKCPSKYEAEGIKS